MNIPNALSDISSEGLSVIIPIYERVSYGEALLKSYAAAIKPDMPYELLFVDNSTNTNTSDTLRSFAGQYGATYCHSEKGVVNARNKGAEMARYPFLLFIDSDCTLDVNVLVEYSRLIREKHPACAAGKTEFKGKESIWWKGIKDMVYFYPFRWCEWDLEMTWAPSCNLLIRADVFSDVGGFRKLSAPKEVSEDVDICQRITDAGHSISKCPCGIVYHTTETWNQLSSILSRFYRFGVGQAELIFEHKEHINALPSITNMFWVLLSLTVLFSCFAQWTVVMSLVFLIIANQLFFLLIQYLRLHDRNSLWSLAMHMVIEFMYDTGKLFHSIRRKRFFFFRNFVYSDEMVMGLWNKNVDEYCTYLVSLFSLFIVLCLR